MRQNKGSPKVRVLLFVTTRRRDLFPMKRIATELSRQNNYTVMLSGMTDFFYSLLFFRPHIILFGKPDNAQGLWLQCLSGCTIVSLNTEQGGLDRDSVLFNYLEGQWVSEKNETHGPALDFVHHHLVIDNETKDFLSPFIDPKSIHVVGYPRLVRNKPALTANPVNGKIVIGVAGGEDIVDKDYIVETFNIYRNRAYPPWKNIEASHAYTILEYLWLNLMVSELKSFYHTIVRYRIGIGSYLQDQTGIELDFSDSLEYLFSSIDLLVVGQSTTGVEALMAGIPAITVAGLIQPSDGYRGARNFFVPRMVWQPNTLEEFYDMVEARSTNRLGLAPDMDTYESTVRRTYYNGLETDNSIEAIVAVIRHCERGPGAELDLDRLADLQTLSGKERVLLWLARFVSSRLARWLAVTYTRVKRRLVPDSYLRHHVYLPD